MSTATDIHTAATASAPLWSVTVTWATETANPGNGARTLTERVRANSGLEAIQALAGFLALPVSAFTSMAAQAL